VPGGEERAVEDLAWLIRGELGEEASVLERDSGRLRPSRAALALLAGGLQPESVTAAVQREGAREAGARVVLHLHNYRLVCAIGTCFTRGEDCTRCHGRNTLPGVGLRCRSSLPEAVVYGAGLSLWQRRLVRNVDAFVVPSEFALGRLRELGAPVGERAHVIPSVQRSFASESLAASGRYALAAGRLSPEKGFADAIDACRLAGVPLVIAGDGPQLDELRSLGGDVRFTGRVSADELAALRRGAAVAVVPSRFAEILPLAALEAMAAGLPVVAAHAGGLAETVPSAGLYPPGDVNALADRIRALFGDADAGEASLAAARERFAPSVVAAALRRVYSGH
jgi:glycosyltransferase involved in cell wall biosynthesis